MFNLDKIVKFWQRKMHDRLSAEKSQKVISETRRMESLRPPKVKRVTPKIKCSKNNTMQSRRQIHYRKRKAENHKKGKKK